MTKRSRGIWHAWHFQFALGLVVTALCGSFCSACLHPLTRRYVNYEVICHLYKIFHSLKICFSSSFGKVIGSFLKKTLRI
ncbi:DUF3265 domain-containing protein [Vibrio cholerae]|nr:DUF3265 domain-containing protein [Vibrio cholerae]